MFGLASGLVVGGKLPPTPRWRWCASGRLSQRPQSMVPLLSVCHAVIVRPEMRAHAGALAATFLVGVGGEGGALLLGGGLDRRFGPGGAVVVLAIPAVVAALMLRTAARTVNDDLNSTLRRNHRAPGDERARKREHLPMLSCRGIDFSYGQLQVLFDVDFTVDDGEMVALLGTNGAGKSTLC